MVCSGRPGPSGKGRDSCSRKRALRPRSLRGSKGGRLSARDHQAHTHATAFLIDALGDKELAGHALHELSYLRRKVEPVLPGLIVALDDPEPSNRTQAFGLIGSLGPKARLAVPKLLSLLSRKETYPPG